MKKDILKQIKDGKVKMKPKWQFQMIDKGQRVAWGSAMVLMAASVAMIIMFVKEYEPLSLISEYGEVGKELLIEDFPYIWLTLGMLLMGMSTWLISKIGDNYRKTNKQIWGITLLTLTVVTIAEIFIWSLF